MKRNIVILLSVLFVFSLVACGSKNTSGTTSDNSSNTETSDISDTASGDEKSGDAVDSGADKDISNESTKIWGISSFNIYTPSTTSKQMVDFYPVSLAKELVGVPKLIVGECALEKITSYTSYFGPDVAHNHIYEQYTVDYDSNKIIELSTSYGVDSDRTIAEFNDNYNIIRRSNANETYEYNEDGIMVQIADNTGEIIDLQPEYDERGNIIFYAPGITFLPIYLVDADELVETDQVVYNSNNKITRFGMFNMEYDGDNISKVTWDDKEALLEWDEHGNIISITGDGINKPAYFQYLYDDNGNILFERRINVSEDFYDVYELDSYFRSDDHDDYLDACYYSYDSNGNRVLSYKYENDMYKDKFYTWKRTKNNETLIDPPDTSLYGEYVHSDIYLDFHESIADISLLDVLYNKGRRYATSLYCKFNDKENATVSGYMVDGSRIDGTLKLADYKDYHYQKVTITFTGGDEEGLAAELIGNTFEANYLP